jgi:hypothetical protein
VLDFYASKAATAKRLINKRGRSIELIRLDESAANTSRPWKGPPSTPSETTLPLKGVFVPPNTVRKFGLSALGLGTQLEDMISMSDQVIIVAQGEVDLRIFTEVLDDGMRWGIFASQILKPGDVTLLGFLGVRR